MSVEKVVSNLLDSNTFIVSNGADAVIVDAGCSVEQIKNVVKNKHVLAVLLTHAHYDHAMFAVQYANEFGCKIYASKASQEYLQDMEKNYGPLKIDDFKCFNFFSGDNSFEFSSIKVKAFVLSGHSKCDVCYLIDDVLFAGDLVFKKGIGRMDLYGGSKFEMLESLKRIFEIDFKILQSGHGEASSHEEQSRNLKTFIKFLSR